ncbi:hypothetical protein BD779DRAFT_1678870 [Infundibulicybe gibba]|nr:hypothetical protein BD779DRAFT_1678870 [Infundibulicybe gibba]
MPGSASQVEPTFQATWGAVVALNCASAVFSGCIAMQACTYFHKFFHRDHCILKFAVRTPSLRASPLASSFDSLVSDHLYLVLYERRMFSFGSVTLLLCEFWVMHDIIVVGYYLSSEQVAISPGFPIGLAVGMTISCSVQGIYALRMYRFDYNKYLLVCCCALAGIELGTGFIWVGRTAHAVPAWQEAMLNEESKSIIMIFFAASMVLDMFIAAATCYQLWHSRMMGLKRTRHLVDKLIRWTIQTGILTSAVSLVIVLTENLSRDGDSYVWLGISVLAPNCYAMGLLALLNARTSLDESNTDHLSLPTASPARMSTSRSIGSLAARSATTGSSQGDMSPLALMSSRGRRAAARGVTSAALSRGASTAQPSALPAVAEVVLPSSSPPASQLSDLSAPEDDDVPQSSNRRPRGSSQGGSPFTPTTAKRARVTSPPAGASPSPAIPPPSVTVPPPFLFPLVPSPAPASLHPAVTGLGGGLAPPPFQLLGPASPGPPPSPLLPPASIRSSVAQLPRPRSAQAAHRWLHPHGPSPLARSPVASLPPSTPAGPAPAVPTFNLTQAEIVALQHNFLEAYLRSRSAPPLPRAEVPALSGGLLFLSVLGRGGLAALVPRIPAYLPLYHAFRCLIRLDLRSLPGPSGVVLPSVAPPTGLRPLSGATAVTTRPLHVLATNPVLLDPLASVYPIHEVTILTEGWRRHLSLANLTIRKRSLADRSGNAVTNTLVFGPNGLEIQPVSASPAAEESLTMEEFIQASNCLVDMIPLYLKAGVPGEIGGPQAKLIGEAWRMHYDRLLRRPDFTEVFHVYRRYDLHLRLKWLTDSHTFTPADFQEPIYQMYVNKARDESINSFMAQQASRSFQPVASSSSTSYASSSASSKASDSRASTSKASQKSFRLCIYCGETSHWAKECEAKSAPFLKKSAEDNLWRTPGGRQVCYAYNGKHGKCLKSATCPFEHICSLCGSAAHSAGSCAKK